MSNIQIKTPRRVAGPRRWWGVRSDVLSFTGNVNWFLLGHGYLGQHLISHLCRKKENKITTVLETLKKEWKEWRATNLSPIISMNHSHERQTVAEVRYIHAYLTSLYPYIRFFCGISWRPGTPPSPLVPLWRGKTILSFNCPSWVTVFTF